MTGKKVPLKTTKKKNAYDFSVENDMRAEVIALIQKYHERGIDINDIKVDQYMSSHLSFKFNANHPSIQRLMANFDGQGSHNIPRGMHFDTVEYSDWKALREKQIAEQTEAHKANSHNSIKKVGKGHYLAEFKEK